jgi:heat-inducible transcriptional repressor
MADDRLLEREAQILEEIIQYYLKHQEAVSARTLSKISRLDLSPTTIRNLMEDLSSGGFLTSEGVPRGRIPTQKAFTIYVTRLGGRPARGHPPELRLQGRDGLPYLLEALEQVGLSLAEHTGWVAVASLPPRDRYPLDWVRLDNVPRKQVLVTLRTAFGDLWSKLIPATTPFPDDLLQQVTQYINSSYRRAPLERIRRDVMAGEPKDVLERMPSLGAAFRLLRRAFEWEDGPESRNWGREHLLRSAQGQDPQRLMLFARILSDPLLLPNARANGRAVESGWVSIGTETGYRGLEDCSIVGHPFRVDGWEGQLGVLGPMGMNYGHALQLTTQAAEALTGLLVDLKRQADPRDSGREPSP